MSEAEKRRRQIYKAQRQKWINVIAIVLAALTLLSLIFTVLLYKFNKAYYIEYVENSNIDYQVFLKENEFYEGEYEEADKAYVASLIDKITVDFSYYLNMNADKVNFDYAYSIDAVLQIADKNKGILYERVDALKPEQVLSKTGNSVTISGSQGRVDVDYDMYDELAKKFVEFYELDGTTSTLMLNMHIAIAGDCEEFSDRTNNNYIVSLIIPLNVKTVNMSESSSVKEGDNFILALENATVKNVFKVLTIVFWSLVAACIAFFLVFIYITRNTDINYEIKINRILNNYRSFIQKVTNGFNIEGYQVLMLSTFSEMLEIRDTIQSPILMDENEDKTLTHFLIPTNTNVLYVYEIKIEDYDEIYSKEEFETIVILDEVEEEALEEAIHSPDISLENIDYVDDEVIENLDEGVEVISVVWPEKEKKNKLYRYDPNGESVSDGDIVLVPSRDNAKNRDIIRKAAVAHGNHRVQPDTLHHPLKKIIAIVKRKAEDIICGEASDEMKK